MPKIKVNNIEMYYEIHGEGEPVVMIAGLGTDHTGWQFQLPEYSKKYKCVVFDNRGVGQRDISDMDYSTKMFADDTVALMDALNINRAHIVGASMGGAIAQELAIAYPERVVSLSLHCTWARADNYLRRVFESWALMAKEASLPLLYSSILLWTFTPEYFNERFEDLQEIERLMIENPTPQAPEAFVRQIDACINHDTEDRLGQVKVPTLITVGIDDILVPLRFARVLQERIPNSELITLQGCAHSLCWEKSAEFNRLTLEFLRKH